MIAMHRFTRFAAAAAIVATTASCGDVVRAGRGSSFLVIDSLLGVRGAVAASPAASTLSSDVLTNVTSPAPCTTTAPCPTIFGDSGQVVDAHRHEGRRLREPDDADRVQRHHADPLSRRVHAAPTDATRPASTCRMPSTARSPSRSRRRDLVRILARPSCRRRTSRRSCSFGTRNVFITGLATVTFYGTDGAGNDVSVTGIDRDRLSAISGISSS